MAKQIHLQPFIIHPADDFVSNNRHLSHLGSQLANKYAFRELVTDQDLQAVGTALWQALDVDEAFEVARKQAGPAILSIIIESNRGVVQGLPWETLYHPTFGFLGQDPRFTLSRRFEEDGHTPLLDKGPLRVLLFTSSPDDLHPETQRLQVEEEQARVLEALLPWIQQGIVHLEMPDDGRFETFNSLLNEFQPHVLFLSGHGKFHHQPHSGEAPFGVFLFEDADGDQVEVKDQEIAGALVGSGVQCVVLSACESSKAASLDLTNGLAQTLSMQGFSHVIGMRESVLDTAGIKFTETLCALLAQQERVDYAIQAARKAIQTPLKGLRKRVPNDGLLDEVSLGQWCLPVLFSADPSQPLIDWAFEPRQVKYKQELQLLSIPSLPKRFIGRRMELRKYKNRILKGEVKKLLITGPGGQGKTTLAGKLVLDLENQGYKVFAWSARPEFPWSRFQFSVEISLLGNYAEMYDRGKAKLNSETEIAEILLQFLAEQFDGKVVLFFDNLETLQDPKTLELQDPVVKAWFEAALKHPEVFLFATSRWKVNGWNNELLDLTHANYGDFLQMMHFEMLEKEIKSSLLSDRAQYRKLYDVLGGNSRALLFFLGAVKSNPAAGEQEELLEKMAQQTKEDIQADMAIAKIVSYLEPQAKTLLSRLYVYDVPVPIEGIVKLGLDLDGSPDLLLQWLNDVSLVESLYNPDFQAVLYQVNPLVVDWVEKKKKLDSAQTWLETAADYQVFLLKYQQKTTNQAMITHRALKRARSKDEADQLVLDRIVGPLTRMGLYRTLLDEWLPEVLTSKNETIKAQALNQIGKLNVHIGNYDTALSYLNQSLEIFKQIGDLAGLSNTLNNIATLHQARGDHDSALSYLNQSLEISKQIGDLAGLGTTLNNIGEIYHARGDYDTSLNYLTQSQDIYKQIGDLAGLGSTLNNISQIYKARGDYDSALSYLNQSLAIQEQIGDLQGLGTTFGNIGNIYYARGDYDSALSYLNQSLEIRKQIGDLAGLGATLNNISQIYKARGDYDSALSYLNHSLKIFKQIGDLAGLCPTLFNIGFIHIQKDEVQQAVSAWINCYLIAKRINLAQALQALAGLAPQLGMPPGLDGWEALAQQYLNASTNE